MDEAVRLYRQAVEAQPDFAEALLNLGHALKALGQEDEAKSCWRKALEFKPELAHGYFEPATRRSRWRAVAGILSVNGAIV